VNSCEHSNEPAGSIKGDKFIDQQSDHQILRKVSWSMQLAVLIVYIFILSLNALEDKFYVNIF